MLSRLCRMAACVAACISCVGCCNLNCGCKGPSCGKSPYAFMKYDCCCESCGNGICSAGGCCNKCGRKACACGSKVSCGDGCDACSSCGGCRGGCGGGCNGCCGGWFQRTFCCCTGCGELYFNEWFNDPPSKCEPCDCWGHWTGCGGCGCGSTCGCNSCGSGNCGCGATGCANMRAPYRMGAPIVAKSNDRAKPLELADAPVSDGAQAAAEEKLETAATESATIAEKRVDDAVAAGYSDSDLEKRLR